MGARRTNDEGVAICFGLGDEISGDIAACAGLVLDDELLAVFFRHPLRDKAGEQVSGAACRKRNDEFDRAVGPLAGLGNRRRAE